MNQRNVTGTFRIVGGSARGCRLFLPPRAVTRPTPDRLRESLFAILQPYLPGEDVLDLYAGSGALGLEALSRGARHCTFVEKDPRVGAVLNRNCEELGFASRSTVVVRDLALGVPPLSTPVFLAFVDPPFEVFGSAEGERVLRGVLASLTVRALRRDGCVVIRFESRARKQAEAFLSAFGLSLWRQKKYGRSTVVMYRTAEGECGDRHSHSS